MLFIYLMNLTYCNNLVLKLRAAEKETYWCIFVFGKIQKQCSLGDGVGPQLWGVSWVLVLFFLDCYHIELKKQVYSTPARIRVVLLLGNLAFQNQHSFIHFLYPLVPECRFTGISWSLSQLSMGQVASSSHGRREINNHSHSHSHLRTTLSL